MNISNMSEQSEQGSLNNSNISISENKNNLFIINDNGSFIDDNNILEDDCITPKDDDENINSKKKKKNDIININENKNTRIGRSIPHYDSNATTRNVITNIISNRQNFNELNNGITNSLKLSNNNNNNMNVSSNYNNIENNICTSNNINPNINDNNIEGLQNIIRIENQSSHIKTISSNISQTNPCNINIMSGQINSFVMCNMNLALTPIQEINEYNIIRENNSPDFNISDNIQQHIPTNNCDFNKFSQTQNHYVGNTNQNEQQNEQNNSTNQNTPNSSETGNENNSRNRDTHNNNNNRNNRSSNGNSNNDENDDNDNGHNSENGNNNENGHNNENDFSEEIENEEEIKENPSNVLVNNNNNTSGINIVDNLTQHLQKELTCPICLDYFYLPVTMNCGHTFCRYCIGHNKLNGKNCPLCRQPLGHSSCINTILSNLVRIYNLRRKSLKIYKSIEIVNTVDDIWWNENFIKSQVSVSLFLRIFLHDMISPPIFFDDLSSCIIDFFTVNNLWSKAKYVFNINDCKAFSELVGYDKDNKELTNERLHAWVERYITQNPSMCMRKDEKIILKLYQDRTHRIDSHIFDSSVLPNRLPWDGGRHAKSLIHMPHSSVSLSHLLFVKVDNNNIGVVDCGSTIGTMIKVNNYHVLKEGDIIHIGDRLEVTVSIDKNTAGMPYKGYVWNKNSNKVLDRHELNELIKSESSTPTDTGAISTDPITGKIIDSNNINEINLNNNSDINILEDNNTLLNYCENIESNLLIKFDFGTVKEEITLKTEYIDPKGVVLGRGPYAQSSYKKISVTNSNGYVSREHCLIYYDGSKPSGERWLLRDTSTLGTFLKIKPFSEPVPLPIGSIFKAGQCKIEVCSHDTLQFAQYPERSISLHNTNNPSNTDNFNNNNYGDNRNIDNDSNHGRNNSSGNSGNNSNGANSRNYRNNQNQYYNQMGSDLNIPLNNNLINSETSANSETSTHSNGENNLNNQRGCYNFNFHIGQNTNDISEPLNDNAYYSSNTNQYNFNSEVIQSFVQSNGQLANHENNIISRNIINPNSEAQHTNRDTYFYNYLRHERNIQNITNLNDINCINPVNNTNPYWARYNRGDVRNCIPYTMNQCEYRENVNNYYAHVNQIKDENVEEELYYESEISRQNLSIPNFSQNQSGGGDNWDYRY
ncbi:zinc finger protein, putative [Plasmodium berghei]|nr:zinc finger protein, putative [Plasmodium berghei]SCN23338.1 zinc finger protein, putative [Plasmodium berghei]SCO59589.1 zinc finger protein, putative [Plasmodium berghei]